MKFWKRLWASLRGTKGAAAPTDPDGKLREFVYLDDVSVYSILASRKGAIDDEFTETQTASLNSDVGTSLSAGFPGMQAKVGSRLQAAQGQGSQVVRKAIIQTSFKQLYELENHSLAFRPPDNEDMPSAKTIADLERILDSTDNCNWIIDPANVNRGELLEVKVELQADPIFRLASVMATMYDLIDDSKLLFEGVVNLQQLRQIGEVSRMLEAMLVGLIPIRATLANYVSVHIGKRDVLVHQDILDKVTDQDCLETSRVFLVGVTQHDLYWKDVRRVLFSDGQYTVFCRLSKAGLSDRWRPVKLADALSDFMPQFDELISQCSEQARIAMTAAAAQPSVTTNQDTVLAERVINEYAELLVQHHQGTRPPNITTLIPLDDDWLNSVSGRRRVLKQVATRIESDLGVTTSGETARQIRTEALRRAGVDSTLPATTPIGSAEPVPKTPDPAGKFLDAEIIAIYW